MGFGCVFSQSISLQFTRLMPLFARNMEIVIANFLSTRFANLLSSPTEHGV